MSARYFGAAVARVEDPRLLAGRGRYVDDAVLPGMLHAAFVRASMAHGRIRNIDASDAKGMPGVVAIYTMADFAGIAQGAMPPMAPHPLLPTPITYHPLAVEEVCHVGEAIAIVLADDRATAEDAAAAVLLDIEELPAVADAVLAWKAGAPRVHSKRPSNIAASLKAGFSDCDAVFAKADHVLTERFDIHRGGCHSMECRGVVASVDPHSGVLTLSTSSQSPYMVRRHLATYLGRDESEIRVMTPDVGGGFGPKANVYPEEFAVALAAIKTGRPVKWIEDRQEHFVATTQQRGQVWTLDVAFDNDGRMRAIRGHCIHDNGAYAPYGLILPATALASFPGPYALEALDLTIDVVLTNLVPTSPVRGACRPNAAFLLERLADRIARHLGIDRQQVRRRSFVRADQMPYSTGMKARDGSPISYDSGDYIAALDLVLDKIGAAGFEARRAAAADRGKLLGLGIASCVEDTGLGPFEGASVRVTPAGKVVVSTGASSQGQGHRTAFAQIAADALGVELNDVMVETADTSRFPLGMSTIASRIAVTAGSSVELAAQKVRAKAIAFASHKLEVGEQDLELEGGAVRVKGVPGMNVSLSEIARTLAGNVGISLPGGMEPDLAATAYFNSTALTFAYGANACEVEIDPETGDVRVVRYVVVHDCGKLINPLIVDGQIRGGVVHGIGNALFERMIYDEAGQPLTTTYADYFLPLASEMPPIEIHHVETPSPRNPIGVKGAGEGGTIPAAACVISAVENALGSNAPFIHLHPISPQQVVKWLERTASAAKA
ncbi:xanthine dehydrogenase family protein molybdopterin-binding subunit [Bradyrhizobium cenepequi]|uniref:xanthine dehydrogenase family protein molybdopterin-binding subunit n=1 Tax=Bradyrhizobium cenepequi TaxID=2821403 RepID=UPI001CE24928|nr:xanthine dehydrogenase family protein molybdopterin-binding subunit [Bradyrhizobium cenepequi]MCA6108283.1 xanthine dehydrogenase family protein [Bradyrhizobium cenepequi]